MWQHLGTRAKCQVGEEVEWRRGQSAPALRARGGLSLASFRGFYLPEQHFFLPFFILERISSRRERTVSHCQHPLAISALHPPTERGADLGAEEAHVLGFTRALRPDSETQPAAHTPAGHRTLSTEPYRYRKFPHMPGMQTLLGYAVAPSSRLRYPSRPAWSLSLV